MLGSVTAPAVGHQWRVVTFRLSGPSAAPQFLRSASETAGFLWLENLPAQAGAAPPDSGLETELGRLFALELPSGQYRLAVEHTPSRVIQGNRYATLDLDLETGGAVYVGNLHVRHCIYDGGGDRVYRSFIADGLPSVNDRHERDLALLRRRFPGLDIERVLLRLPDASVWLAAECPPGSSRSS